MAFKLAPQSFNAIKPYLMGIVRVVLKVITVNTQLWHHNASGNALDEAHKFLHKPHLGLLTIFIYGVAGL